MDYEEREKIARDMVDNLRAAYTAGMNAGLDPDDLAGLTLCHAFATVQLTYDLSEVELCHMVADLLRGYFKHGYEAAKNDPDIERRPPNERLN